MLQVHLSIGIKSNMNVMIFYPILQHKKSILKTQDISGVNSIARINFKNIIRDNEELKNHFFYEVRINIILK